ncbi:MAG: tetratricopeptide repeat protein [Myxococcales bacterium]|nr:tetratricopeptide repeat protein [Myxococcales bacterium]MCB9752151.1 tetratricopeptide repeat protein [Myxococcales bacterium]
MNRAADSIDAVIDRGLQAVENEDLERAEAALEEAQRLAGENHVRVLHLGGLIAWSEGRLENAAGYLQQAVDLDSNRAEIYLDCAECLAASGNDLQEAEAVLRTLLARDDVDAEAVDQGKLLLAQIRLDDDDTDEALEILSSISPERQEDPVYLSTRALVLEANGQTEAALTALEQAIVADPGDPDLHYQLGLVRESNGDLEGARTAMLRVLELDTDNAGEREPMDPREADALRAQFEEEVLTEVPEPVLDRIASAPIIVQERPTAAQVADGINPRTYVTFLGQPKTDEQEPRLDRIIIMRDLLLDELDDDDDVVPLLFVGLLDEMRAFFRMEGLQMATA